jgi:NRPS condensation-like uncharacterized protein
MTTIPLNLLDELYLNLDRESEPWTVHYEVQVTTRLDPERLASAVADAAGRHPLARARLINWRYLEYGYDWEIAGCLCDVPLTMIECRGDTSLEEIREWLFSASPSLDTVPPFAIVLARHENGDALMLNLHHGAGDGISAERFMLSIMRAYVGEDDPVPALDVRALHDVQDLVAARSGAEQRARDRAMRAGAWRPFVPAARVARDGADNRPAYGFEMFALSADESLTLFAHHPSRTTVNDVLLAGLAVTIRRWNADHGCPDRPIALSMPVNLRPADWREEIFANYASWVTVWVRPEVGEEVNAVATRVAARTRAVKRDRLAGLTVDLLKLSGRMMIAGKRWLQYVRAFTNNAVVDTASLSNLGSIDPLPGVFDTDGTDIWFSPPCQMPLGIGVGVVTFGGRLHITIRYRHTQFDRDAASRFADLYRRVLIGDAARLA